MSDELTEDVVNGSSLRRREFLVAGAAAGVTLAGPVNYVALARGRHLPIAREGKFAHGLASGFPHPKAITLWTRLSEIKRDSQLTLEVAKDKHFRKVVERKKVKALKKNDFTVHTRVGHLKPDHEYFYRFETKEKHSGVGRFRTLPPANSNRPIRVGFFSCQDYEAGFFNAHSALAQEQDLDLVLCLGDYIYEHHYYPGPAARADTTGPNHDGDVQTLAEYRQKYRFYQADPNLQALHAAYPFVAVWDDHEVEDNYAGDGPDSKQKDPAFENNGTTPRRVPFEERRVNGYRAFFEAQPRIQKPRGSDVIYGSVKLGNMAELFLTDERQYRDPQPCDDVLAQPCADDDNPSRTMLGQKQRDWFTKAVLGSNANWKLWASEVMVMSLDVTPGAHGNHDQWDGYGAERKQILTQFHDESVKNLVVLSGDIHTFFAGNLSTTGNSIGGLPVGTELVGGSMTSLGLPQALGAPSSVLKSLAQASDPHLKFYDFDNRGYCVVTAKKDELIGEFRSTDVLQPTSPVQTLATFRVPSGTPSLEQV